MIIVARKPIEGTVAENVQKHGTGGINVDGCRVGFTKGESPYSYPNGAGGIYSVKYQQESNICKDWNNFSTKEDNKPVSGNNMGRWPPNLVMVHHPDCRKIGTKTIKGYAINRWDDGAKPFGDGAGHPYTGEQMPDEEVDVWDCHPDCHVRKMDEQSGDRRSAYPDNPGTAKAYKGASCEDRNRSVFGSGFVNAGAQYADAGGASRFFPCFTYGNEKKNEVSGDSNMAKTTYDLRSGDCLEEMRKMPEASVEAVITDPPYGLSTHTPADVAEALAAWLKGEPYLPKQSGGFMGKSWDAFVPGPEVWGEAHRLLKPGGYLLCFSGTRTSDLMGIAIRMAEFEIRDSILTLHWVYGSGFPKNMDVSKAIDKAAGAEREVVGTSPNWRESKRDRECFGSMEVRGENAGQITVPVTPEAKQWEGWGTALKPAHEPIIIARKMIDGTVAENVQGHGTGAINIESCRVTTEDNLDGGGYSKGDSKGMWTPGEGGGGLGRLPGQFEQPSGRWPPNLVMVHHPECVQVGTKKVKGYAINRFTDGAKPFGDGAGHPFESEKMPDEEVGVWVCHPLCPVRQMDEQSGDLIPCGGTKKTTHNSGMFGIGTPSYSYTDNGGASRFFPAFHYCAKASRSERDAGCEHLHKKTAGEMVDRVTGSPGTQSPRAGAGRLSGAYNHHPTVKPVDLLRWLVRLVCRKGGTVLDPFMGSGTTGLACYDEECNFIGIEVDEGYFTLAEARNKHVRKQLRLF